MSEPPDLQRCTTVEVWPGEGDVLTATSACAPAVAPRRPERAHRRRRARRAGHAWWAASNAWCNAAHPDPAAGDPTLFDRSCHPVVTCWFKASATHLLDRVPGYPALLDRHGVPWRSVDSDGPGRVLYEDADQVVTTPHGT